MKPIYEEYDMTEDFGDSLLVKNYSLKNKFMNKLKTLLNWIVWSSKNSDRVSTTVKAGLSFLLLLGIGSETDLNILSDNFNTLVVSWATVISGLGTIFGAGRKIVLTLKSWWTNR